MNGLFDFLSQSEISVDRNYSFENNSKIGNHIQFLNAENDDWSDADLIILGCGNLFNNESSESNIHNGPEKIREAFFNLYNWHPQIKVADIGNLRKGATELDTRAALKTVLKELEHSGKIVVTLGGRHDMMLQQYEVFEEQEKLIEATGIDRFIDLKDTEGLDDSNFLMQMLTRRPNFVEQYNHLGFQSYDVAPKVLETLDKLGFDCVRLGTLRAALNEAEPIIRQSNIVSIDLQVLRYCDAPFLNDTSPNGLFGDELCQLTHYAGMSNQLSSLGIYGYRPELDYQNMGARLIAQMLWYFIDGVRIRKQEADLSDEGNFISYYVDITGNNTQFRKSKKTNRWWMQLPDKEFIPCSYNDYLIAVKGELPNRWIRYQSRIV